jgi:NADH:ubiquinone oxidoreductase subunit 2 (subunit N)
MSETKLKRLLAFSSIGHIGILLMGLSCGSVESVQAALLYLIIYTVMSINMFASILSLDQPSRTNKWQVSSSYLYIYDFHRLSNSNPLLAFNLTMILFSMAGVPPLAGFCSKFFVFFSLLNSSLYALALLAVLASVISSFYYIRIVKTMYFEKRETTWTSYQPMSRENSLLVSFSLGFVMLFFIYPSPFFLLTQFMSLSILF